MNLESLIQSLKSKYPVILDIFSRRVKDGEHAGGILISRIELPKEEQKKGFGTEIMDELTKFADKNNLIIALTPEKVTNTSKTALIRFYKTFGFVSNKGRNKHWDFTDAMIRYPKKLNEMVEKIKGGNADGKTVEDLARKHHQFIGTIEKELKKGIEVEFEHTNDEDIAREIAMDHIDEFWDYYSNPEHGLNAMEKKLKQDEKERKTNEGILSAFNDLLNEEVPNHKKQ